MEACCLLCGKIQFLVIIRQLRLLISPEVFVSNIFSKKPILKGWHTIINIIPVSILVSTFND